MHQPSHPYVIHSIPPVSSPRRRSGMRRLRELSLANPLVNASLKSLEACSRWALLCKSVRTARRLDKGQPLVGSASGCYLRADSPVAPVVRQQVGQHSTRAWGEESRRPTRCARGGEVSASAAKYHKRWATASRRRSSSSPCSGPSCTASSRPALCGNQPVRRVHRVDGVEDDAVEEGPEQGEQDERRREAVAHRLWYFAALRHLLSNRIGRAAAVIWAARARLQEV